jgi:hypothetical protein
MREQLNKCTSFDIILGSGDSYSIVLFEELTREQMETLINILNDDIYAMSTRNNQGWHYDITLTFRNEHGQIGYINMAVNEYEFQRSLDFIFTEID